MSVNQNESKLLSIFVQGTLYGAFFIMFILTYWTLVLRRPSGRPLNKTMLGVSVAMFVLATIHIIINLIRILQAFVGHRDRTKSYWNQLSEPTNLFGNGIYFLQTLVGDGVALYRCWVVWGRRREYMIMPGLFYLGSFVTGVGTLASFGKLTDASVFALRAWLVSFFSFTLATSTICTFMIATRIWFLSRKSLGQHRPGGHLYPIMRIVLESGIIYSGTLIALLVLFETQSWFQYVLIDSTTPIIGLVFSIIIVRVGLGITTDGPSPPTDSFDNPQLDTTDISHHPISHDSLRISRFSRDSSILSPSHFWPAQPDRPLNIPQRQSRNIKSSILSFNKRGGLVAKNQGHYTLRSQISHPSSFFRVSTEMGMDLKLEAEIDDARYKRPKVPPLAVLLPSSDHHTFTQ